MSRPFLFARIIYFSAGNKIFRILFRTNSILPSKVSRVRELRENRKQSQLP